MPPEPAPAEAGACPSLPLKQHGRSLWPEWCSDEIASFVETLDHPSGSNVPTDSDMRRIRSLAGRLVIAIAFTVHAVSPGYAQRADTDSSLTAEELRVLALEDEYVPAEVNRDEAALRRILDDRFQYNRGDGTVVGKEEYIQSIMNLRMVGQELSERSILMEDDVALVFGTATLRFASESGEETVATLRYTSTYINRDGQWRMLAVQLQKRAGT